MITINGKEANYQQLISRFQQNDIERKILKILWDSSYKYDYDTEKQLNFELAFRKEIIKAAYELHKTKLEFAVFRETICNARYWRRQHDGGFLLREDVKPSDAIKDIFINPKLYSTECATAMVIVYYKALLNLFPEPLFNELFDRIYLMNWHYIDNLLKEIGYMRSQPDYLPGDRRYVKNPDVDPSTPEWQGENLIDMGNGIYYGHGMGMHRINAIISELNRNRRPGASQSAMLLDSAGRPNFKNLAKIYYDYLNGRQ